MKKITFLFAMVVSLALLSCSEEDNNSTGTGDLKISGQVMAPNNDFPISKAKVQVFRGSEKVAETITDALGNFTVEQLEQGNVTVELSKGKFSRTINLSLESDYVLGATQRSLNSFPNIAVVKGTYDSIEEVLFNIGVVDSISGEPAFDIIDGATGRMASGNKPFHGDFSARTSSLETNVTFSIAQLLHNPTQLAGYDIIFFNCSTNDELRNDEQAMTNLKAFIENGGIVYATDWMYTYVQSMFPTDYLHFAQPEKSGNSTTAETVLGSTELETWLAAQGINVTPTLLVEGFLPAWQMVDTFNDANVDAWVIATSVNYGGTTVADKPLAFTFGHGCGGVFYSSFHTHGNTSANAALDQLMSYFVFELSGLGTNCGGN